MLRKLAPLFSWKRIAENRLATAGALFLVLLALALAAVHLFYPHSPTALTEARLSPPSTEHWFGTDINGRDLLARTSFGLLISILVGVFGAALSLIIGTAWGSLAAWFGGWIDSAMMRIVDVLYSMPSILFVIVLMAGYDAVAAPWMEARFADSGDAASRERGAELASFMRLLLLYAGLGLVSWLTIARIVRGEVLALKERTFIRASRILGASSPHILLRHILPNLYGTLMVYLTLTIPSIILYESFLSFLGLGIQPPYASLGSLIARGAEQINAIRIYWWMIVFPGLALVATLLAFNFVGDGLRERINLGRR